MRAISTMEDDAVQSAYGGLSTTGGVDASPNFQIDPNEGYPDASEVDGNLSSQANLGKINTRVTSSSRNCFCMKKRTVKLGLSEPSISRTTLA